MRNRTIAILFATAALVASTSAAGAASPWERADVFGQGMGGPVVAANAAAILRTSGGVSAKISMPTPAPGSYVYPVGPTGSGVAGHPEAFSHWLFVFFNPEECAAAVCGPADLINDPDVVAGAFNVGGHLVGGPNLTLSGHANTSSMTFGGPNAETIGQALAMGYDIAGAEIHLAIAPHGALDPSLLPASISTPVGTPDHWWLALFL